MRNEEPFAQAFSLTIIWRGLFQVCSYTHLTGAKIAIHIIEQIIKSVWQEGWRF